MRAYTDIPEGQVHYQTAGDGEPLLLLHQTPMFSEEYSLMIPILAPIFRVIAMDTLGYGNSNKPPAGFQIDRGSGCGRRRIRLFHPGSRHFDPV